MDNAAIAKIFYEIADLLEIKGDNPFRIRSYRNAAAAIENHGESFETMVREGQVDLKTIPGIGEAISGKIKEIVETGDCRARRDLLAEIPQSLLELLTIQGIGPRTAGLLYKQLGVKTVDEVERLAAEGKLRDLPGLGAKSEQKILQAIQNRKKFSGRHELNVAEEAAHAIIQYLRDAIPDASKKKTKGKGDEEILIVPAGSLRRGRETIGDIDILVSGEAVEGMIDRFVKYPEVDVVLAHGETKGSVKLKNGLQVDLRVVERESFGAALQYFTGSKEHNIALRGRAQRMGYTINEYGLFALGAGGEKEKRVAGRTEEEIYAKLGLPYLEPELRENRGEIDAAEQHQLPRLIEVSDVKGDLHMHTNETDGRHSLREMVEAARARGLQYIAITDHTRSTYVANGMDEARLEKQIQAIDELQKQYNDIRILKGTECDILQDGRLDLSDDILAQLDVVVISVHSHMNQEKAQLMERLERAFSNPHVKIFAHPTGRLLFHREPYAVDMEALIRLAKKYDVCLELNSQPERLDLNDVHVRMTKEAGVKIVISTDSHSTQNLHFIHYGIRTARRGWIEPANVVNTLSADRFLQAIQRTF